LGPNPLAIKLPSAIVGLLTIFPIYFLIRLLFNQKLAFLTTFFVAISGWHITMSKTGWRAIMVPLFSLTAFYFFFKALKRRQNRDYALTGIALAATLYTYDAARVFPLFFATWLGYCILIKKINLNRDFKKLVLLGISFLITMLPLLFYAKNNWLNFTSRDSFLFVGDQIKERGSLSPLWDNLKTSLLLFNYRANGNDFFIYEPLVDRFISWLLPVGLIAAIVEITKNKKRAYLFTLLLFLFFLIPGIFSVPNGNRAIGALPMVYFFISLGLLTVIDFISYSWLSQKKRFVAVLMAIFLTAAACKTYHDYLGPDRKELPGFYPETFTTLDYLNGLKNKQSYDFYFTDNYPRELLTFLLYQPGRKDPFQKNYTWLEKNTDFLEITKKSGKGIGFAMFDNYANQLVTNQLLEKYPAAREIHLHYQNGKIDRPASIFVLVPQS